MDKDKFDYIKDFRYSEGMKVADLVEQLEKCGFTSSKVYEATEIIKKMKRDGAKIVFTFTSNMVTSGLRGLFAQFIASGMVDVVVTTVGGVEEDFIKAKKNKFILGSYNVNDEKLHTQGLNRVGNIYIPTDSYIDFEKHIRPILAEMYTEKKVWKAREIVSRLGSKLDDENSILYQCHKNGIPVYCPAITDGSLGTQLASFQMEKEDFIVDVVNDISQLINDCFDYSKIGIIALGGGASKHFALLGAIMRGGMDYAVFVSTARPFSGSASSATTEEGKSWGKIKSEINNTTVVGEVSVLFPLIACKVLDDLSKEGVL